MSAPSIDQDVMFNRVNLKFEKSRRLLESWLPPTTNQDQGLEADVERVYEEAETFESVHSLVGLGAVSKEEPSDLSSLEQTLSSNERIRKQLLGKYSQKYGVKAQIEGSRALPTAMGSKQQPSTRLEHDEEAEEGRSGLGRKRKYRDSGRAGNERLALLGHSSSETTGEVELEELGNIGVSRRASNYLDEVLQAKAKKKNKKRHKTSK